MFQMLPALCEIMRAADDAPTAIWRLVMAVYFTFLMLQEAVAMAGIHAAFSSPSTALSSRDLIK